MRYSEIIPQSLQEELSQISTNETRNSWRIGEIANQIFINASLQGGALSFQFVCSAVSYYCGRSVSSVMQLAKVEKQFPPEIREEFDGLPFSHFEIAGKTNNPIEVLEYSVENYPISAAKISEHFGNKISMSGEILKLVHKLIPLLKNETVRDRLQGIIDELLEISRLVDTQKETM